VLKRKENILPRFAYSLEKVLFLSAVLTFVFFLIHVGFLVLVDPLRLLPFSKEDALTYSAIPMFFGVLCLITAMYCFIKMERRTISHIALLLVALSFGSMSLQGLLGVGTHYVMQELQTW
jgi:uncharacterized membrane protein YesL